MPNLQYDRQEMEKAISRDYPNANPFIIRNLLDIYFSENGKVKLDNIVKESIKAERKQKKKDPIVPPKEIITNIVVQKWDESDYPARCEAERCRILKPVEPELEPESEILSAVQIEQDVSV